MASRWQMFLENQTKFGIIVRAGPAEIWHVISPFLLRSHPLFYWYSNITSLLENQNVAEQSEFCLFYQKLGQNLSFS